MTPPSNSGQDAAVAVLQTQQATLEASVRQLSTEMSTHFGALTAKMDRMSELSATLIQLQERQIAHSDGLNRAFNELQAVRSEHDHLVSIRDKFQSEHAEEHRAIDKRHSTVRGIVIGVSFAYGTTIGLLVWMATMYIGKVDRHTESIHNIELNEARNHPTDNLGGAR